MTEPIAPIVCSCVSLGLKIGWFQDCCREIERVLEREVKRVHGLRSHPPFVWINLFSELGELMAIFQLPCAQCVSDRIIRSNNQVLIITPRFRVTHADLQCFDFRLSLFLGCRRHPRKRIYSPIKRGAPASRTRSAFRFSAFWKTSKSTPMLARSAGISVFLRHPPLAYSSKSSPGFTSRSR